MGLMISLLICSVAITQESSNDANFSFTPPPLPQGVNIPSYDQLQSYDDLPVDIRREVIRPQISVHFYSDDPDKRYALINGFRGREGLPIGRELWIHEILPDGVVLRIQNQFFLIKP